MLKKLVLKFHFAFDDKEATQIALDILHNAKQNDR